MRRILSRMTLPRLPCLITQISSAVKTDPEKKNSNYPPWRKDSRGFFLDRYRIYHYNRKKLMIRHGESGRNPSFFRDSAQFFGQREKKIHKIKKKKKIEKNTCNTRKHCVYLQLL